MLGIGNFLNLRKSTDCFMDYEKGLGRDLERKKNTFMKI